ncbi:peptidoglycan L-alanyl-D-glutamate endopeptidase CwlK [Duganella sp. CF458]|uniref:M15 family metallopeptidase n=1 Tax=Duganella sp. CF458 TaxID=1884368 RepID=UPI0008ECE6E6|nr:M15 family metallopeptidase [Duganella sp. CF458]SFG93131.1 peptidoglycan L-alanyl-D-glutamate endopeptidase CwlK [Duganella sp. CF458]
MLPFIVAGVFVVASAAGWLLLFPPKRRPSLRQRRMLLIGAGTAVLAGTPAALVRLLRPQQMLPEFEDSGRAVDPQVAALLQGEQLVPPLPLPPLVFSAAEVELLRPMLSQADRDWQLLDKDFARRLLLVFNLMRERHGYQMALLEGYRSAERQDRLAAAGSHVSNARAFQSFHQFGLAADCAFVREGKLVISERDPWAMRGYQLYGEAAEALGMVWGGRWTMMDFGHTELRTRDTGA